MTEDRQHKILNSLRLAEITVSDVKFVLRATKNVAVLYTIAFMVSCAGALTFFSGKIVSAVSGGKFSNYKKYLTPCG